MSDAPMISPFRSRYSDDWVRNSKYSWEVPSRTPNYDRKFFNRTKKKHKRLKRIAHLYAQQLVRNATRPERYVKQLLNHLRIKYTFQKVFMLDETFRIVDFYFKMGRRKIAIELDGEHHFTPEGKEYDAHREKMIRARYNFVEFVRYPNSEVFKPDFQDRLLWTLGITPRNHRATFAAESQLEKDFRATLASDPGPYRLQALEPSDK